MVKRKRFLNRELIKCVPEPKKKSKQQNEQCNSVE